MSECLLQRFLAQALQKLLVSQALLALPFPALLAGAPKQLVICFVVEVQRMGVTDSQLHQGLLCLPSLFVLEVDLQQQQLSQQLSGYPASEPASAALPP